LSVPVQAITGPATPVTRTTPSLTEVSHVLGNKRAAMTRAAPFVAAGRMSGPGDGNGNGNGNGTGNGSRTAPPAPPHAHTQVIVFE
jgi:hypothetical protein